jgi:hypothetical protein
MSKPQAQHQRFGLTGAVLSVFAACALAFHTHAQNGISAGESFDWKGHSVQPIALDEGIEGVAAAQFDVVYDSEAVMVADIQAGPTAADNGKQVDFSIVEPGRARVVLAGFNQEELESGVVADVVFAPANGGGPMTGLEPVQIEGVELAGPSGEPVAVTHEQAEQAQEEASTKAGDDPQRQQEAPAEADAAPNTAGAPGAAPGVAGGRGGGLPAGSVQPEEAGADAASRGAAPAARRADSRRRTPYFNRSRVGSSSGRTRSYSAESSGAQTNRRYARGSYAPVDDGRTFTAEAEAAPARLAAVRSEAASSRRSALRPRTSDAMDHEEQEDASVAAAHSAAAEEEDWLRRLKLGTAGAAVLLTALFVGRHLI